MANTSAQQILKKVFKDTIIPWAKSGMLSPFLVQAPLQVPDDVKIQSSFSVSLADAERHPFSLNPDRWPEFGLHTSRYPCLGCVLEGETDICIGMAERASTINTDIHVRCFSMSRQDFFVIPSGMPYSDASRPHWKHPKPETAYARTLWMRVLPMGPIFQISTTKGLSHGETPAVLIRDTRFQSLAGFLMTTMQKGPNEIEVAQACLLTLLLAIDNSWPRSHVLVEDTSKSISATTKLHSLGQSEGGNIVSVAERAREYIQENLIQHTLTLPQVAHHAYISTPQLKRLFKSEFNVSVMEYVTLRRIEVAKSLLAETDLPIREICVLSGYQQRTHFSRLFKKRTGFSPRDFRSQCNNTPANQMIKRRRRH